MTLLNIRTAADVRAFIYAAVPVVAAILVGYGIFQQEEATLWVAFALAIFGPALAAIKSPNGFRQWFYVVLGAGNAVAIFYGIAHVGDLETWIPVVNLVLGSVTGGVAAANTDTTSASV